MKNISKIVVSKDDAKRLGYILDFVLDYENFDLLGYVIVDEESENEYFANLKDLSFSESFAFVDDVEKLQFLNDKQESLLFKKVVSNSGVDLGEVVDLKFFRKHCVKLITSKCELKTKNIKTIGDVILLGKRKIIRKNFPKQSGDFNVKILNNSQARIPEKVSLSNSYYLGKIVNQDIFGYNNERLISKGEKVNKINLDRVKQHNKLAQLFFAIKK